MTNISAILASTGLFACITTIVQLLLNRKWQKQDRNEEVIKLIKDVDKKLDGHIAVQDEQDAKQARVRIIRLADDIRLGNPVSDEYIANCMEDIDQYEAYCASHPDFPNSKAQLSIGIVKDAYLHPKGEDNADS